MDRNQEHIAPSQHSDVPPDRPERTTGAGREATEPKLEEHDTEHRSGYGGKAGKPDTSSDQR